MSIAVGDMVQVVYGFAPKSIYIIVSYYEWSQTYDLYCPETGRNIWEDGWRLNNRELYRKLA